MKPILHIDRENRNRLACFRHWRSYRDSNTALHWRIMCGIAGMFLRHDQADPALVKSVCDRIRHRGPDDEGYHVDGGCAIGMRRLSVIDLNTGHQPISNEDGSVWVVFNGEIYNYRELR